MIWGSVRSIDVSVRTRRRLAVAVALAAIFTLVLPARGHAQERRAPVRLSWSAPAGCPDARELGREIRRQLRDPESVRSSEPLSVRATASADATGWKLVLEIRSAT